MALPKLKKGEKIIGEGEQVTGFFAIDGVSTAFEDVKFRIGTSKPNDNHFYIIIKRKKWPFRKLKKSRVEMYPERLNGEIHEGFGDSES